jgi:phage tail-like protein
MDLWDWFEEVQSPPAPGSYRIDGSISMVTYDGSEVARWNFTNGWPSKVSGPSFKSDSNTFGVEEVVLVHEGLERAS